MLNSTLPHTQANTSEPLTELARFCAISADSTQMCPMFSPCIDQAWHTLLATPDSYAKFSREACGQVLRHQERLGTVGFPGSPTTRPASGSSLRCGLPMPPARSTRPVPGRPRPATGDVATARAPHPGANPTSARLVSRPGPHPPQKHHRCPRSATSGIGSAHLAKGSIAGPIPRCW